MHLKSYRQGNTEKKNSIDKIVLEKKTVDKHLKSYRQDSNGKNSPDAPEKL